MRPTGFKPSFYDRLIDWSHVHELLSEFRQHELEEAVHHLELALDAAVLEGVLSYLERADHESFLEKVFARYDDNQLLDWLEEKSPGVGDHLTTVLQDTKKKLRIILEI